MAFGTRFHGVGVGKAAIVIRVYMYYLTKLCSHWRGDKEKRL